MAERVLTVRELNRATLARQLLLERRPLTAADAIERLAGLQAQAAAPPFVGLWTRLRDFDADELRRLIGAKKVVRATMMRHTVHLMTVDDYVRFREPIQPALERMFGGITSKRVTQAELDVAVAAARERFAERPHTFAEIRRLIEELLPDADHAAVAYGVRTHVRLVAQPTDGRWCFSGTAPYALSEQFLGRNLRRSTDPSELIVRYLAAFGPATVADVQAWSGRPGLRDAVDALRPKLRTFRDERGRELFDVPDGPLPDPQTPAPVRFLADWDNTILSHADRTRVIADEHRKAMVKAARVYAGVLLDGIVAGRWGVEKKGKKATLVVTPFRRLVKAERTALAAEAEPLVRFAHPDMKTHDVRFDPPA
ncbi:MAG: winged helix DNA-binding domain-containing protein [Thermoleophilaceae bacterium]